MQTGRRHVLKGGLIMGASLLFPGVVVAAASDPDTLLATASLPRDGDISIGRADAKLVLVEYASLTCPHCAAFHNETKPAIEDRYIKEGAVRLVYRHYPLDRPALLAALAVEMLPGSRQPKALDILFKDSSWAVQNDVQSALFERLAALMPENLGSIDLKSISERIAAGITEARDSFGVTSTPTFIADGRRQVGAMKQDDAFAFIDGLLAKNG